jgi:hypothetical protein
MTNILINKKNETIKPLYLSYEVNLINDIGFEHLILDNLIIGGQQIQRIYFLNSREETIRGNHAHLNQFQILILISGSAKLDLTDKNGIKTSWDLKKLPVFIPKNHWIELHMEEHTQVLCLASLTYDKLITVKNKQEFLDK